MDVDPAWDAVVEAGGGLKIVDHQQGCSGTIYVDEIDGAVAQPIVFSISLGIDQFDDPADQGRR